MSKVMKNDVIWRYFTYDKWKLLLEDNGLFFSVANFQNDKKEGHCNLNPLLAFIAGKKNDINVMNKVSNMLTSINQQAKGSTYLSCWNRGFSVREDMWAGYAPEPDGVVIKSHVCTLMENIPRSLSRIMQCGRVGYVRSLEDITDIHSVFCHKHKRYVRECEWRLFFDDTHLSLFRGSPEDPDVRVGSVPFRYSDPEFNRGNPDADLRKKNNGYIVNFSLPEIIEEVRVHPRASPEHISCIKNEMKQMNLRCQLILSDNEHK